MIERAAAVTFMGNPLTLVGPEIKAGDSAPSFTVLAPDLSPVTLESSRGKIRLVSVVPSIDTPVCDQQTRRFNEEAARLPESVELLTISADLPFAQARYCGAAGIQRVKLLSDHRDLSFGQAYGLLIKELRLLSRAVIVIAADDTIRYVECVKEITNHPDYQTALEAAQKAVG
jgi:thiol peroxidase